MAWRVIQVSPLLLLINNELNFYCRGRFRRARFSRLGSLTEALDESQNGKVTLHLLACARMWDRCLDTMFSRIRSAKRLSYPIASCGSICLKCGP